MIKELDKEFIGTGEVGGYKFVQIESTDRGYLYKVTTTEDNIHYEIFLRKLVPLCIDFEKKIFSETDFKCVYPKANSFGISAWTTKDYNEATERLNRL